MALSINTKNLYQALLMGWALMWDAGQHPKIMGDIKIVVPRLSQVKGKTFGISVGEAKRLKTRVEPDAQATILKQIIAVCNDHGI